jgi:hypothetical protein
MKGRTFGHVVHCQHVAKGLWVLILTTGFNCPHLQWRNLYPVCCIHNLSSSNIHRTVSSVELDPTNVHRTLSPTNIHRTVSPVELDHTSIYRTVSPVELDHKNIHRTVSPVELDPTNIHRTVSSVKLDPRPVAGYILAHLIFYSYICTNRHIRKCFKQVGYYEMKRRIR